MAGSAGFLALEVKLDMDAAEKGLKALGAAAKQELGKPIQIDASSWQHMARTLSQLEGSYASTLAIVEKMNRSTAHLAQSTRSVVQLSQQANEEQSRQVRLAEEAGRTQRATLAVQQEQVRAAGELAVEQAKAQGKTDYLRQQREETLRLAEAKARLDRENKKLIESDKQEARAASAEAAEQRKLARAMEETAQKSGTLKTGMKAMFSGADWGVTAIGAAQARNYGYSLGALSNGVKATITALRGLGPVATAAAAAIVLIGVAAIGAAVAVAALATSIVKFGLRAGVETETLTNQLNSLLPTAEMATQEIESLFALGTRTVAPTSVLIDLDKRLLMAGGSAAQMRQQILEGYAAFSSVAGLTTEQMQSLNYLIGEVTLKGRLMRTELSQQASSAGLSVPKLLRSIADATGQSLDQVNAKLDAGTLSSKEFLMGLTNYFNTYKAGAAETLASVSALAANIKDQLVSGMGLAFERTGAVKAFGTILQQIMGMVQRLAPAFAEIASAANYFFSLIADKMKMIAGSEGGDMMLWFFARALPTAIRFAGNVIGWFLDGVHLMMPAFRLIARSITSTVGVFKALGGAGNAMRRVLIVIAATVVGTAAAFRIFIGLVQGAIFFIKAFTSAISGDFAGASKAMYQGVGAIVGGFQDGIRAANDFTEAIGEIGKASKEVEPSKRQDMGAEFFGDTMREKGGKGGAGKGGASKAANELASALATLWDETRRWLGQRSSLEQSLLGGLKGFTATADQIIADAIRIRQVLAKAGYGDKSQLVIWFTKEVFALAKLANQREKLQKKLEEQQNTLKELQQQRSEMAKSITASLNAFAFALQTESETVTKWTRLDAVGSFVVETKKTTRSWTETLKERLEKIKKFILAIKALKKAGLNPETIRQLVEAGPDAAADAVAELTAGGAGTINEVNAIQSEISDLTGEFGEDMASDYYDAGIESTKALIKGTETEIANVSKAAAKIAKAINDELAKIAKPASDSGSSAGSGFADSFMDAANGGLGTGITIPPLDISGVEIGEGLGESLSLDFEQIGRDAIGGLLKGMTDWIKNTPIYKWVDEHIVRPVKDFLGIASPSTTFAEMGGDVIAGFIQGISDAIANNPIINFFQDGFEATKTWLTTTLPANIRAWAGTAWTSLKNGWPGDLATWISGKFASAKNWLTVTLPANIRTWSGTIWGNLKSGFPDVLGWIQGKWQSTIDWLKGAGRYAGGGLPGKIKGAITSLSTSLSFSKLGDAAAKAMKDAINKILKRWNDLRITFPKAEYNLLGKHFTIGGWVIDTPNIPLLAQGGVVTRPTLAGIGERGPEAILPLTNDRIMAKIAEAMRGRGVDQMPSIRVYIGDREITEMVRVEVDRANGRTAAKLYAGRGS